MSLAFASASDSIVEKVVGGALNPSGTWLSGQPAKGDAPLKPASKKSYKKSNYPESRKSPGEKGVSMEVVGRLKQARLAARVSLQDAGSKLRICLSTLYWMEQGRAAMSNEQAETLFQFYAERTCEAAAIVAAAMGT